MKKSFNKNEYFKEFHLEKKRCKVIPYPLPAYSERFKISSKEKQDLMKLFTDLQISKMYRIIAFMLIFLIWKLNRAEKGLDDLKQFYTNLSKTLNDEPNDEHP